MFTTREQFIAQYVLKHYEPGDDLLAVIKDAAATWEAIVDYLETEQ